MNSQALRIELRITVLEKHLDHFPPLLRAHESSSDLVQSVCIQILAHADRFEFQGEEQFRNWLYGAVLHEVSAHRDHYLADKRKPPGRLLADTEAMLAAVYTTSFDPSARADHRERIDQLERAFDVLSPEQREILTLHRIVGLPHREIAAKFGRTVEATRQILHRAMAQLAIALRANRRET